MELIAELQGGPCDGVQVVPGMMDEEDDWPDILGMSLVASTNCYNYYNGDNTPFMRDGVIILHYDYIPDADNMDALGALIVATES